MQQTNVEQHQQKKKFGTERSVANGGRCYNSECSRNEETGKLAKLGWCKTCKVRMERYMEEGTI